MAQLAGFKESGMRKIADRMGYTGPMTGFTEYLNANPDKQQMMNSYVNKAMLMASGGYVRKFQEGGVNPPPPPDRFNVPEGFNREAYLTANPDVTKAISMGQFASAEDHFRKFGGGEQRAGSVGLPVGFDSYRYIEANPDLVQAYEEEKGIPITARQPTADIDKFAKDHFTRFGFQEGRPLNLGADPRDPDPITRVDTTQPPPPDTTTPPADDRDTVTQPPPEGTGAGQGSYLGPDGLPTQADFSNPTNKPFTPIEDFETYLTNRPDVVEAINAGETFGLNPAFLGPNVNRRKKLAERHYQLFGRDEGVGIDGLPTQPPASTDTGASVGEIAGDIISGSGQPQRFDTFQDLQNAPRESLTPQQLHALNFYSASPEMQEQINRDTPNYQLPVGDSSNFRALGIPYWLNRPEPGAIVNQQVTTYTDPVTGAQFTAPTGGYTVQSAFEQDRTGFRPDPEQPRGPVTDPSAALQADITAFENLPDRQIEDYLFQNPDLFDLFGGDIERAKQHFREFGAREIREGGRPARIAGLTPQQIEIYRFANPDLANLNDLEIRQQYLRNGFNEIQAGTRFTNVNSRILTDEEASIYLENNPDLIGMSLEEAKRHFIRFGNDEMLTGKREKIEQLVPPTSPYSGLTSIGDISAARMERPAFTSGTRVTPEGIPVSTGTTLSTTTNLGEVVGDRTASVETAAAPTGATATPQGTIGQVAGTTETAADVKTVTDATTGRTMSLTKAKPDAAQQTTSAVTGKTAETGTGIKIDPDTQVQRAAITDEEKVEASAEASEAAKFIESIKAETADPSKLATVAGQLETLLTDFDASNPPSWAKGAMRAATAELARRGFGASSIAGQAIVQAAMESALPIAQADASVFAQFEAQNLSNKQQTALFYAQQRAAFMGQEFDQKFQARVTNAARIADIADKNFTAQQQVQLENSNIVNTMNLNNLSNKQAVQMAEIAALAQLDIANLNNRQQAAVQEAQAFLQKDLTDVTNAQQTALFNAQQRIQSMFTDAAADNARKQFNATSQNQSDQFFANLATQTSQFNDAQKNAINQFNAGQENTIGRFNEELNNQRDQFNAQNRLVIDQSNAQWRRSIATADTAATNRANELNAEALLDISNTAYNDLWQYYSDAMEFAWTSAENERTRTVNLAIEQLRADNNVNLAEIKNDFASSVGFGNLIGTFLTAPSSSAAGGFLSSFGSGVSSVVETGVEALLGFS